METEKQQALIQDCTVVSHSVATQRTISFLFVLMTFIPLGPVYAQYTDGRWVFGLHGGTNMWLNDYNRRVAGEGWELMARYGISREISLGLVTGFEELKSNQSYVPYYMKLQAFPISAVGWIHLAPEGPFYPYVYVGAGGLIYKRFKWGPVNDTQGKFKSSFHLPIGAGFESFLSRDISFSVDLDVRIMSDNTDGRAYRHFNGYATIKAGAEVYFGTSITEEEERARERVRQIEESSAAETRRLRELAEAEAQRLKAVADSEAQRHKDSVEAQRLAELKAFHPADTVIVLIRGKTLSLNGVNFAVGNATLTEDAKAKLRQVFNTLIASPEVKVLIVGHTDRVGNEAANKRLSLRRAQTVRSWLVKEGIPLKRLSVAGHGSDEPIDDDSTPEGRANNRRVEFRVLQ